MERNLRARKGIQILSVTRTARISDIHITWQTNDHDMECMFSHCPQGCLAQEGACPFKHTPLHEHTFSGGNPYVMEESFGYYGYDF
jgi:hypothetical protein